MNFEHLGATLIKAMGLPATERMEAAMPIALAAAFEHLTPAQQMVLRRRFALDGGSPETLEGIAASDPELTVNRVHALEHAALVSLSEIVAGRAPRVQQPR